MPKKVKDIEAGNKLYTDKQYVSNSAEPINEMIFRETNTPVDEDGIPLRPELNALAGRKKSNSVDTNMNEIEIKEEKVRWNEKQVLYAKENRVKLVQHAIDERLEYTEKIDQVRADEMGKLINPNYRPLSRRERKERAALSDEARKKYAELCAKRIIATKIVNQYPPSITRTEECLLNIDLSPEAFKFNDDVKRKIQSKDPEQIKEAYGHALESFLSIDIEHIDLTDDKYIVEHMDELGQIISSGPEIVNLINEYQKYEDMSDPKLKPLFERLGALADIGYIAKQKLDVICSPVYEQFRLEDIPNNFVVTDFEVPETEATINLEAALFGEQLPGNGTTYNGVYESSFQQIATLNLIFGENPLLDRKLSPEERMKQYQKGYWDRTPEIRPKDPVEEKEEVIEANQPEEKISELEDYSKIVERQEEFKEYQKISQEREAFDNFEVPEASKIEHKGDPTVELPDINQFRRPQAKTESGKIEIEAKDEYGDDFETDETLEGLETKDFLEDMTFDEAVELSEGFDEIRKENEVKEFNNIHEDIIIEEEPGTEALELNDDGTLSMNQRLKDYEKKFRENIKVIQSVFPDFEMTDYEIKMCVNPKRVMLHDRAIELDNVYNEVKKDVVTNPVFKRIVSVFMDKSGTPEAKEYNEKVAQALGDNSSKSMEFKKELIGKWLTKTNQIDPKFIKNPNLEEVGDFVLDNADSMYFGMAITDIDTSIREYMGMEISEDRKADFKNTKDKGEVLGGAGVGLRNLMANDIFLTLPFEKLTPDQMLVLQSSFLRISKERNEPNLMNDFVKAMNYKLGMNSLQSYKDAKNPNFDSNVFENKIPSLEDTKNSLETLYKNLKDADNWYNFNNSEEYRDVLKTAKKLVEKLSKVDGSFTTYPEDLFNDFQELSTNLMDYMAHTGGNAKNDTQQKRMDIVNDMMKLVDGVAKDSTIFELFVERQNDIEVKEYYGELQEERDFKIDDNSLGLDTKYGIDAFGINNANEKETKFKQGLERTNKLVEEFNSLPDGPKRTIDGYVIKARNELASYVGREQIDLAQIKPLVAVILAGNNAKPLLEINENLGLRFFKESCKEMEASKALDHVLEDFTSEAINDFLCGPAEHETLKEYQSQKKSLHEKDIKPLKESKAEKLMERTDFKNIEEIQGPGKGGMGLS